MSSLVHLHTKDNVALTLEMLPEGTVAEGDITATTTILARHKIATKPIPAGAIIYKYGHPIGQASSDIAVGDHVHTHNCEMLASRDETSDTSNIAPIKAAPTDEQATFQGYKRPGGKVGTRNFIGIITTVNCSATVAKQITRKIERSGYLDNLTNVDGLVAITHGTGCGMQSSGEAFEILQRTLSGYIDHPNFGGVLVIGLGCEVMQLEKLSSEDDQRIVKKLNIQKAGGTTKAIAEGISIVKGMAEEVNNLERSTQSASHLTIALQCGGSDAYSAISANPALGIAADTLVKNGGSAILSETPEIYGAEHLLLARAASEDVAQALKDRIKWWEDYAAMHGATLNSNPSPGNLAGGITTILEKSLGAQAKGGSTPLNAVLRYGEKRTVAGLNFMDSPGYDPVSVTGQVASGANIVLFTTGRGSAFGFKPVPSIKLATNTALFEHMPEDMDINCGGVLTKDETLEECGVRIFNEILAVASGETTSSEHLDYGDNEFTPWQLGGTF